MKRILFIISLSFILLIVVSKSATSQISIGGLPLSLSYKAANNQYQTINIDKPDMLKVALEDELSNKRNNKGYRIGLNIAVNKGINNSGTWTRLSNGDKIWRLKITAKDAMALSLYYDKFYIPKGGKLFLYNDGYRNIIGAFTNINNSTSGLFATELTSGETVTLEYNQPENVNDSAIINISEVNYAYRSVNGFGGSGTCEVNVNCSEGDNWKKQKQGVVKILIKTGGLTSMCSGSVVNNVRQDFTPYVLTADHCETEFGITTPADLAQWIFYFDYEAPSCANPSSEGTLASNTMTGATKVAAAGIDTGSDFFLILLNNTIPESYNPYFNGWDRQNIPSTSGVGIHHPDGDLKKISTYTDTLKSYDNTGLGILTHWKTTWVPTTNGFGVTEGGSSGSPLFNSTGKLIGTLTGGPSDCSHTDPTDYFGKFYYHWDLNSSSPQGRLKDWLDPDSTGVAQLNGVFYTHIDFTADRTYIPIGSTVNFADKSTGGQYQYQWKFEGAVPDTSNDKNPVNILYPNTGSYSVTMKVSNSDTTFTKIKTDYIRVYDNVNLYPNPASDFIWLDIEYNNYSSIKISIYNMFGMLVKSTEQTLTNEKRIYFNTASFSSGIYLFRIEGNDNVLEKKVIIIHK